MIYVYQFDERLLKKFIFNEDGNNYTVLIFQRYVSYLLPGPWFPASPILARVSNEKGEEVNPKYWGDELKRQIRQEKQRIPFQVSLFRNSIIFGLIVALCAFIMPQLAQQKKKDLERYHAELVQELANIQSGDIFRVKIAEESGNTSYIKGVGLIKITSVSGDTIRFVRSTELKEYKYSEEMRHLDLHEFGTKEYMASKKILEHIDPSNAHLLNSIPVDTRENSQNLGDVLGKQ